MKHRIISALTALALIVGLCPTWAFAEEPVSDTGLCDHHTAHTVECGYSAPTEGAACGHAHDDTCGCAAAADEVPCGMDCVDTDGDGEIDHAEGCAYTPAVAERPCQHVHDDACGYVPEEEGAPCGNDCRVCPLQALIDALPVAGAVMADSAPENELITDTSAPLPGEVTIVAAESVVESVAIPENTRIVYGDGQTLTATVTFKDGAPTGAQVTYQWYIYAGEGEVKEEDFYPLDDACESTLSLSMLPAGTYQFRCDVTALDQTTQSNEATVTVVESTTNFTAERVPSENEEAPDTYAFGDIIEIKTFVQPTGESAAQPAMLASTMAETTTGATETTPETPQTPMQIAVYENNKLLTSLAWESRMVDGVSQTILCLVQLPAAILGSGNHELTLKFTGYPGRLAASDPFPLKPFTVKPSVCGDNHTVDPETGICSEPGCSVHFDAKIGGNYYVTLDQAVAAAFDNTENPESATITLLPPLDSSMPFVNASPFTVPTGKNLTIEAPAGIEGIITQITVEDRASLSLPKLVIVSSMEILNTGDPSICQESPALHVNGKLTMNDGGIAGLVVGENATKLDISGSQVVYMSAEKRTLADIQAMMPGYAFCNWDEGLWLTRDELDESVFEGIIEVFPAPAILATPASVEVPFGYPEGQIPTLDATAEENPDEYANLHGTIAPTYQWYKDGTVIEDATEATYTVPTGLAGGKHTYYCYVTCTDDENGVCILRSETATVTVTAKTVSSPDIRLSADNFAWDGTPKQPAVTVFDGTTEIPSGEYTVSYQNNTAPGTATVIITDKDGGSYTVSGSKTFTITRSGGSSGGGSSGGSSSKPSGSTSTLPVSTDTSTSGGVPAKETVAAPSANNENGTASATIDSNVGDEIVKQATDNNSENVVIAPEITGDVTKTEVSIPAATVSGISGRTNAGLTVSTPVASVTIPNSGLGALSASTGTVTVTTGRTGGTLELSIQRNGQSVDSVPGGLTLNVPVEQTAPGTVAVLVHEDGTREVVRKSLAKDGNLSIPLDGSAKLEIVDNSKQFSDVSSDSWMADAVAFTSAHELFNGTGANQFSPAQPMSRGMLAVVLHNLESNPEQALTGAFSDVTDGAWYAEGIVWAAEKGIVSGYGNGSFGPDDSITREQLAVMLWRYAGNPAATDKELHFADADQTDGWALEAMRWAVEQGIINGKDGLLDPTSKATRAEVAAMLMRYMKNTQA